MIELLIASIAGSITTLIILQLLPKKCQHPAGFLSVEKGHTRKQIDEDFDHVTYHLFCQKCSTVIAITYADVRDGVDAFFERGRQKLKKSKS